MCVLVKKKKNETSARRKRSARPLSFADGAPRCHGRSDITISHGVLRASQLCGHCSECESSISLCTQQARKPSLFFFFPLFPSLVTGKGSIFSLHIWSYGAPPVSSSLLMPYKHPYFVWDLYFLACLFLQFCLIVGVASESALLKGTQAFYKSKTREELYCPALLFHKEAAFLQYYL